MKVRALKSFEGIRDLERSKLEGRDIFPKEGDIWETTKERAMFLKEHGVVEIVEEKKEEFIVPIIGHKKNDVEGIFPLDEKSFEKVGEEIVKHIEIKTKSSKKKKSSKK